MANPQKENGHVDIANDIMDALARIRISGEEWQILCVIFRKTYGWHKKSDAISISQFHEITQIKKPSVIRAIKKLLAKKLIAVSNNANDLNVKEYQFNKNYDEWQPLAKKLIVSNNANLALAKMLPTKETITKEKKRIKEKIILPDWIKPDIWDAFIEMRVGIKSRPTERAQQLLIKKLGDLKAEGNNPDDVLNQSIMHGWRGLFPVKDKITQGREKEL